jgi:hypothetical protein
MYDVILDIPPWLHGAIIRDWITLKSMALLDMAYCEQTGRALLLKAFNVAKIVTRVEIWLVSPHAETFMLWALARGLAVQHAAIASSLSVITTFHFVRSISASLTTI